MEITLNKTELAGALTALGKLVCRTSPIPMYHAVQIESINNMLFFRTHRADEEIEFRMETDGLDAFKVAMDFDIFCSLVRNNRSKNIKIEFADGNLRIDGSTIKPIEGEWPLVEAPQGNSVSITPLPWTFVKVLSTAAPLVDMKEARIILRGMNLSRDGITVASNKELFNCPYQFNLDELTIPFPLALMATKAEGAGELRAWSNDFFTMFSVNIGKWSWIAKALPGAYPNWKRVLPKREDLKYSVSFNHDCAERLKTFLKPLTDSKKPNGIMLYRKANDLLSLRAMDGRDCDIPAEFDSAWGDFSVIICKERLLHLLNEGHTKLMFCDALGPFVGTGGIGQYIAMPLHLPKQQVDAKQTEQVNVRAEQTAPQSTPESTESKSEQIPSHQQVPPSTTNINSNKEKTKMETNTNTHIVSAPMQTVAQNNENTKELNPLDELLATVEQLKGKLKATFDDSMALSRKVREVALAQRQKEREYVQTKKTIERIRTASGF